MQRPVITSVYNGPFVLTGFDGPGTDTEWSYEKNDQYWDQENVKLQTINVSVVKESATSLNLFQDGQADDVILTGELAQQMANDEAFCFRAFGPDLLYRIESARRKFSIP